VRVRTAADGADARAQQARCGLLHPVGGGGGGYGRGGGGGGGGEGAGPPEQHGELGAVGAASALTSSCRPVLFHGYGGERGRRWRAPLGYGHGGAEENGGAESAAPGWPWRAEESGDGQEALVLWIFLDGKDVRGERIGMGGEGNDPAWGPRRTGVTRRRRNDMFPSSEL
jgi:hypothetical protein